MLVDVHAVGLLCLPLLAAVVLLTAQRRTPTWGQTALATALAAGATLLVLSGFSLHMCDRGNPVAQCLVAGLSLWAVALFVRSRALRATAVTGVVALMVLTSYHYIKVVHDPGWTGNPAASAWAFKEGERPRHLSALADLRRRAAVTSGSESIRYPAGWVADLPLSPLLPRVNEGGGPVRIEVGRAWHSCFTRMFPVRRVRQGFWYPGGPLRHAAKAIELRDRPGHQTMAP